MKLIDSPLCEAVLYQFLGMCASSRRKNAATPPSSFQVQPMSNKGTKPTLNQYIIWKFPWYHYQLTYQCLQTKVTLSSNKCI